MTITELPVPVDQYHRSPYIAELGMTIAGILLVVGGLAVWATLTVALGLTTYAALTFGPGLVVGGLITLFAVPVAARANR